MGKIFKDDVSIVLSGEAGQGIQTIEKILTKILKEEGFNVFATKEYMSRIRGGSNSTEIRVGSDTVRTHINKIDLLLPLTKKSVDHLENRIDTETIIIAEKETLNLDNKNLIDIPIFKIANEIGSKIYSNIVAVGFVLSLFGIEKEQLKKHMENYFAKKSKDIIQKNIQAIEKGYDEGKKLYSSEDLKIQIKNNEETKDNLLINGNDAVALGALAGGCDSIFSYPMTPGTGVLLSLANFSQKFDDILVEQAEDEIAAINMAIGGWYAGARSMVTTSGGGFSLMEEGVSLAGMLESPMVIHIAQRPGPATGLPTRTAQEDLNLALYSGHGEFPRIIYAPGNIEDAFFIAQKAFNEADKYQVPVFLLTDQYFVDSYYNVKKFNLDNIKIEKYFIKTDKNYKRYKITENGISPRGIPNYGEGIVGVDSDEHDEYGHITEDLDIRIKMMDKRMGKLDLLKENAIMPEIIGSEDFKNLIISWGSNYNSVKEALKKSKIKNTSMLHFTQLYPLNNKVKDLLKKAEKIIVVENNATGQFANLLKLETNINIDNRILKYDGMPFSVEELIKKIEEII
ncbi:MULTISPECIES: 2-oxoacid:acceptor oxidoreductase subunit alpha [Oceanotoga]|jgi:2-oxoglutarate ferredoxin oxidoreductase subunit alpha|uniref:2-oxoacid:acceptor oxidoreductase subunit alpha n=1 Tax=Oceanotoga TaxID=1255275 RepID=UPI00264E0736|nr:MULTISPECIES: 2-oxoacid:acceptor oxidoreductase subunit alpha [Oceanotoga]MDN5343397.1 2-oxoglutarate/2-oxoacid ferredoxin oxidoreductase subunit alpha [Oceanotoga sp.]MDO7976298.1 2-oxoacid:acceptor oxidoreductase subunit alpha [Oceanotoga teriensis]